MNLLSEDDLDIAELSPAELDAAWDLWFDLAQATNEDDPPYTHGVFAGLRRDDRDWLAVLGECPVETSDPPPRRGTLAKRREL